MSIWYKIFIINVKKAGGGMRDCHTPGPSSILGRDKFPGWGFSGFSLTYKTNIRKL